MTDDQAHTLELASIHRRRLRELEKQQAQYGRACPPEISMEIDDLRSRIQRLEASLREEMRQLIPPLLPYLVNRADQELCLDETLQRLSSQDPYPIVCLVHGDEFQCHDMFLDRLIQVSLPQLLKLDPEQKVSHYPIEWPASRDRAPDMPRRLQRSLAEVILDRSTAPIEEINQTLAAHPTPVIVHTHLFTEDWIQHGGDGIVRFLRFWQSWPGLPIGQVLIVCLFIKYQGKPNLGWWKRLRFRQINAAIAKTLETLSFDEFDRLICTVLPRLEGITRQQAEHWARSEEARRFCFGEDIFSEIRTIYERWEQQGSLSAIPMEDLANYLIEILQRQVLTKRGLA